MIQTTVPATPDNPNPQPPHGGDWLRQEDGSLTLVQHTQDRATAPAEATPTPTQE